MANTYGMCVWMADEDRWELALSSVAKRDVELAVGLMADYAKSEFVGIVIARGGGVKELEHLCSLLPPIPRTDVFMAHYAVTEAVAKRAGWDRGCMADEPEGEDGEAGRDPVN